MSEPLAPLNLSLVVITRDAGAELAECLDSASFARRRLSSIGSTDDTVEIAPVAAVRALSSRRGSGSAQKNFAVTQATHD
jgi:hypothetical protein